MLDRDAQLAALKPLCEGMDEEVLRDFVTRMDPEYFRRFDLKDVAKHIALAARLDPDAPCQVLIEPTSDGLLDLVIIAYDYFSEFAGICGVLAAFGLDIREGEIYTFAEALPVSPQRAAARPRRRSTTRPGLSRKKIVDFFRVQPGPHQPFSSDHQPALIQALQQLIGLLDAQQFEDARRRVNRMLAEALGRTRSKFTGLLYPIEIRFDNDLSPTDTVMDIRSVDTPAFLFAFANALAMRGLYIHKAHIAQAGKEIHDRFWVRGRHGQKLATPQDQQELRITATLIKQFTHFLVWAPDPAKAIEHFDLFLDRILDEARGADSDRALAFLKEKKTLTLLARVLGTSDYLWEDFLRRQHANLLPVLEDYQQMPLIRPRNDIARELQLRVGRAKTDDLKHRALNQYKDRELFRIDMIHLTETGSTLSDFSRALTELAEVVIAQALRDCQTLLGKAYGTPRLADGSDCPIALFGLGKFGGSELGYASDIEILSVYGGTGRTNGRTKLDNSEYFERLIQAILQRIEAKQEGIFHLDVRLRPHGSKGLLASPLGEIRRYYADDGLAAPFERQALIKLRPVAGDEKLGRQVEQHRDVFVYSGRPWDVPAALSLRRQQIKEFVDLGQINVKYSPGGLIDLEYAVQYLQLQHGHLKPQCRNTNTLAAMSALAQAGVLTMEEANGLRDAYLFLRGLIDGLRIVRGHAKDLVLPSERSEEFVFLARRLGYQTEDWREGASHLSAEIHRHMELARGFFARRFGSGQPD